MGPGARVRSGGDGRGGQGRRGAAQLGRPLLVVRSSAPGPPALHHRSPASVAWAWSPRHPLGTDSASPDPLWEAELGQAGSQRPGRHGKLPRPLPLAGPCLGPAAPWPNRCVRRRRAASEPNPPGRCRSSTLRTRIVGSPDEREGSGLQTFQEHKARSHFAVSATEAQEPMSKGRVSEGSASWRRPLHGSRSIRVRYEAEGDKIASSPPPRGIKAGTSVLLSRSEAANSLVALAGHRASGGPGTSLGLGGSALASRAMELPRRFPVPRMRRNKSEGSAEHLRLRGDGGRRARCGAPGAPGSPNSRRVHLLRPGAGRQARGTDSAGNPHPLPRPQICARGDAPRSPCPLLRLLDLAWVLKARPYCTPAASESRVLRPPAVEKGAATFSTSLAATLLQGSQRNGRLEGSRRCYIGFLRSQIRDTASQIKKKDPSLSPHASACCLCLPAVAPTRGVCLWLQSTEGLFGSPGCRSADLPTPSPTRMPSGPSGAGSACPVPTHAPSSLSTPSELPLRNLSPRPRGEERNGDFREGRGAEGVD